MNLLKRLIAYLCPKNRPLQKHSLGCTCDECTYGTKPEDAR